MQLIRPALLALAFITAVGCATAPAPQVSDLTLELLDLDGQSVSLSTYRGHVVQAVRGIVSRLRQVAARVRRPRLSGFGRERRR